MRYISVLVVFIGVLSNFSSAQEETASTLLDVEKIWAEYQFFGKSVEGFRSMKDGEHYTRFETNGGIKSIIKYAFEGGETSGEVLLDGKSLQFNGKLLNVDNYIFNEDETKLLLTVNTVKRYRRSYYAIYYLYDLITNKLSPLDMERIPQTLASYSPDGKKVAYIYQNNLYVKDLESDKVKQLTKDGEENKIINGTTDWVYEEEFAFTKAYDWAPNSINIAYLRFDESNVKEFSIEYFYDLYPENYTFKYPKAGEDNSKVTLHLANIKNGKNISYSLGEYEYIPRLQFSTVENKLMVLTLNRHQNQAKYFWIDILKKNEVSVIYEEKDEKYLNIDDNFYFFKDGQSFIRTSEKDGYNHIYRIGIDGKVTQITKGDWDVKSFEGIDEEKGLIYYTSGEEGPQYSALYVNSLDDSKKDKLTPNKGTNSVTFSKGMKYFVNNWSTINTPPIYSLNRADGSLVRNLESNEELQERIQHYNFQPKNFIKVNGEAEDLNAWILYPPKFDSTKQYPVYLNIYGGPGSNTVVDRYNGGDGAYHQLLAQNGYIVMSVDPRGTMYRGAHFLRSTYLQLGKKEIEDFIAVAKQIKTWDFVDSSRIGMMGWSYGGYMTCLAMTKGAPHFKMGIAVAPVTNWRYYDNIYTERFMRTPQENSEGYDNNSPINFVDLLQGKLFLIHGSGDDNVHLQNTMEMVKALVDEDKAFDLFIYPNKNHGIYGGNTRNHLFKMMFDYTLNNL